MEKQRKQDVGNHSLESEFIPYKEALALKDLGFDEPCFGRYQKLHKNDSFNYYRNRGISEDNRSKNSSLTKDSEIVTAPLYQQAFRWLSLQLSKKLVYSTDIKEQQQYLKTLIDELRNIQDNKPK